MGYGDELMAMGRAERLHRETGRRVAILDKAGKRRWSPVWVGHPAIVNPCEPVSASHMTIVDCSGARPYLAGWDTWNCSARARFTDWSANSHRGRLYLSLPELKQGRQLQERLGDFVVLEPGIYGSSSSNKDWGFERYEQLVAALPDLKFIQTMPGPRRAPARVMPLFTPSFREACGILAAASAYVGPEGGMHHAAAALGIPAVVLFGGFTSPVNTGYELHRNLFVAGPESPCGRYAPCGHCREAMASITVADVAAALKGVLAGELTGGVHAR